MKEINAIYAAANSAEEAYNSDYDAYVEANNGEEPNWDDPVIWFDGDQAGWYWGGDAEADAAHQNHLRYSLNEFITGNMSQADIAHDIAQM